MNEFGITNEVFEQILIVFTQIPEIKKVVLFGSRARGDYKKTSDIDLAIWFEGEDKKMLVIRMLDELRCILKFDVVAMNEITNELLKNNINKDGRVIYARRIRSGTTEKVALNF